MHHGSRREFLIGFSLFFVLGILKIEFVDLMASFRSGLLALGCICFLYFMHFKISKIPNRKLARPSSRAVLRTKSFHEKLACCVACIEKIKFGGKI
jgi:hypothetical protein